MTTANFELAARSKLRFESPKGLLSAEDLWDLPLTSKAGQANLDDIAKNLNRSLKEADGEVSFVKPVVKTSDTMQAKFDIVKYVIDVKVAERDTAAEAADKAAKKQKLMELIAAKQDAALTALGVEDLQKMLADL